MRSTDAQIMAAHARWELQLAILQEEEGRLIDSLEEYSRKGSALPSEILDRLKMSRELCNAAFQALMARLERESLGHPGR